MFKKKVFHIFLAIACRLKSLNKKHLMFSTESVKILNSQGNIYSFALHSLELNPCIIIVFCLHNRTLQCTKQNASFGIWTCPLCIFIQQNRFKSQFEWCAESFVNGCGIWVNVHLVHSLLCWTMTYKVLRTADNLLH